MHSLKTFSMTLRQDEKNKTKQKQKKNLKRRGVSSLNYGTAFSSISIVIRLVVSSSDQQ